MEDCTAAWTAHILTRIPKISVHAADVKSVLRVFSIEVPAREKDDLKEDPIIVKLRKVRTSRCFYAVELIAIL